MSNHELANMFFDIADMLEIEDVQWEPRAYRKAALSISTLPVDVKQLYEQGKLTEIEGVGKSIAASIEEYVKTGTMTKYEKLKKEYPVDFTTFRKIQGMGPKRVYALYKKLRIKNLDDLRSAIEKNKIRKLEGFGEKSEEQLRHNMESFSRVKSERRMLGYVIDDLEALVEKLRKSGFFERVETAGSSRRMKETVGDFDILAVSGNPEKGMDFFVKMKEVDEVIVKGSTKTSVKLDMGLNCDLRVVETKSFGAAMQYFTGNKDHNVKLRKIAISKGLKLNEYGVFRKEKSIAGDTEKEVYASLGLDVMEPELRENMGEIEAARTHSLPNIVGYGEIQGDLHMHTANSDGINTLDEMLSAAKKWGHKYVAITEHSRSLPVAKGLDDKRFEELFKKIDRVNEKSDIKILKGVELEILKDGSLDLSSQTLKNMDIIIGAIHQWTRGQDRRTLTNRMLKAIDTGLITTIAHPSGRMIGKREAFDMDFQRIYESCKKNGVFLEINGFPDRSDLPFNMVKEAKSFGVKFTLGSDSHGVDHVRFIRLATAIARRGWLERKDVVNTMSYNDILKLRR